MRILYLKLNFRSLVFSDLPNEGDFSVEARLRSPFSVCFLGGDDLAWVLLQELKQEIVVGVFSEVQALYVLKHHFQSFYFMLKIKFILYK